jgi:trehalose 6-phosphate synthase
VLPFVLALAFVGSERVFTAQEPETVTAAAGHLEPARLVLPMSDTAVVQTPYVTRQAEAPAAIRPIRIGALAMSMAALTFIAYRLSRRHWTDALRRVLREGRVTPELQPVLSDVREFVDRLRAHERTQDSPWNAGRLSDLVRTSLLGERVIVLANREPVIHVRTEDGAVVPTHPASGLVTALEPIVAACSGVWVAHGSGSADRDLVDSRDGLDIPAGDPSYRLRRVWLTQEEEQGYYYGFANEGLWPLCHLAHVRPVFRLDDLHAYWQINDRFAEAAAQEARSDSPIVLVQDYHFALAPRILRERLPKATIVTFWHIPWPNAESFGICPWSKHLLEGLLGSSILGFHTQTHCNNFLDTVDRTLEAHVDRENGAVTYAGRRVLVRAYPISVEWPSRWSGDAPDIATCRSLVREQLGIKPDTRIALGVDRLDYTKGIEEKLSSVERLLESHPELRGEFVFVQLAAPSRERLPAYRQLGARVREIVTRVNGRFGRDGYQPIVLLEQHHEPADVQRFMRAADVCYVSSLHDGMNLVAKEFVGAREDERGVLVLSAFTGAARELSDAIVVNPYDIEAGARALAFALTMSEEEQRDRMGHMRAHVAYHNAYRWAGTMLTDAARLRDRERRIARQTSHTMAYES